MNKFIRIIGLLTLFSCLIYSGVHTANTFLSGLICGVVWCEFLNVINE